MDKPIPLAVAVRPNGKTYRARRPPEVHEYEHPDGTGIMVIRCTSEEVARKIAATYLSGFDLNPFEARFSWARLVPFDPAHEYERIWQHDPVRGVPCISFEESI